MHHFIGATDFMFCLDSPLRFFFLLPFHVLVLIICEQTRDPTHDSQCSAKSWSSLQPLAIWGLKFQVRLWTHAAKSWMALTFPWRQEVRGQWAFWHVSLTCGAPHVFFVPLGEGTTWPGRAANVRGYIYREMSRWQYFCFFSVSVTLCRLVLAWAVSFFEALGNQAVS